ncbi:MAG: hypothetical protein PPP56_07735 [Longimonas sp.]|uniref:hypothetical protein n=1 Tax=Longimonas sp. TaxID=2039626 RepID=UPI0033629492
MSSGRPNDGSSSNSRGYEPIACATYDELGLRMMRGTCTRFTIETPSTTRAVTGRIEDIYSDDSAEYIRLDTGDVVRLDHIVQVEDVDDAAQ